MEQKSTLASPFEMLLAELVKRQVLTQAQACEIKEAAVTETQEKVGMAVAHAILQERAEIESLRRQRTALAEALEAETTKSIYDSKAGGTLTKEYFEDVILLTFVRTLCTTNRGVDRRTTWPTLHFLDGRRFGVYNKWFNQLVGDQIIALMGKSLLQSVRMHDELGRQIDYVGHVGGDEFSILEADLKSFHEGRDSQQRYHDFIRAAAWGDIQMVLEHEPPQMDIGSICIKSASLRNHGFGDADFQRIARRWYELGSLKMKEAKQEGNDLFGILQYDTKVDDFVPVAESELRYEQKRRKP